MEVTFFISNDTLSKSLRHHRLYPIMISILYKTKHIEKNLFDFERILKRILNIFVNKNFTSCIGEFFPISICEMILKMYRKFSIDIPIINSLLAVTGMLGIYYKEIIELALYDNSNNSFPEKIELNRIMCEQFPYLKIINLKVYLSILRIKESFTIEIYDYITNKYISGEIVNILNREENTNKEIEWNEMSVYFN